MKRLAIFASGSGTNAENISLHFSGNPNISVEVIITNNPEAGVIQRAKKLNIPFEVVTRKEFSDSTKVVKLLKDYKIDVIVLAGFLLLVPVITIHHVNEFFDDGEIIFQAACHIAKDDTPESLAEKIHDLEKMYFPVVIEKFVQQLL